MSGYKRVNFYELCRLCATNQQKEKTHIFQEEGRKIQLQNKIQSCLSLKVCENDFLPKVVCSQCLRTLEECSTFRKECYTSETMLSSYFNNFRYTEDFKKSGKVYIKDTSPKAVTTDLSVQIPTSTSNNTSYNVSVVPTNVNSTIAQETVPYYTLHLPSVLPQAPEAKSIKDAKILTQPQIVYNLNAIKAVVPNMKTNLTDAVTVNSNGEIITIAPLVDVDALFTQNVIQKPQRKIHHRKNKLTDASGGKTAEDSNVIKIDLTQPDVDLKRDAALKLQQNKVSYTIKIDDSAKAPFVLNSALEMNGNANLNCSSNLNRTNVNFNANQSVILNPPPPPPLQQRPTVSVPNLANRPPKPYPNFTNLGIPGGSNLNLNPAPDLNPEPPPNLNVSSTVNLPVSTFNPMHYSISNTKQESIPVDNVGLTSDALANMFSATNQTCPILRNGNLNSIPTQNLSFNNNLSGAGSFTTANLPQGTSQAPAFVGNSLDVATKQDNGGAKKHSCDICCKTFKRREHLYQHVKLHTGFRPFKCENCNKSFMRKEHLLRHMTSHSGQKNFTCSICEKSFSRNDNLLKHKKIHNKQNSFTCEICQKQFVMEHYYLAHKLSHDTDKCNVNPVWGLLKAV